MPLIGRTRYSEPKAVLIRNPEDLKSVHSTIGVMIHIDVDNKEQGQLIMDLLPDLLSELNDGIEENLNAAFPSD